MHKSTILLSGFALLMPTLSLTLLSCKVCGDVGCITGLTVQFSNAIPAGTTVTASSQRDGQRTVTCESPTACSQLLFRDFTPSEVSVTVELSGGTHTQDFLPEYRTFRPNGEDCDPTCMSAMVQVTL